MFKKILLALLPVICVSCIGTDILDDTIVPEEVSITSENTVLQVGESAQINANYTNQYGIDEMVMFDWMSDMAGIASIDQNGRVTALRGGQATMHATYEMTLSNGLTFTVVESSNDVAVVEVESPGNNLTVGGTLQFSATAYNINEMVISDRSVTWGSSNTEVATIDDNGLLTALLDGSTIVTATVDGIVSEPFPVTVGSNEKTGVFMGVNGYRSEGIASLKFDASDNLILELSSDFDASFALGTFIYLSNTTNGQQVKSAGLDLGEITTGGAHSFNVTEFDSSVDLDTYRYVVVLCKPAGITFGFADLGE